MDAQRETLEQQQHKTYRDAPLDNEPKRDAPWIRGTFQHGKRRHRKSPGSRDHHQAARDQENQDPDQIDPCPAFKSQALVNDVDPHMTVV